MNERDSRVAMFDLSTCIGDDLPVELLYIYYIDSSFSD